MSTLSGLGTNRNRRQGFPVLAVFSIFMLLAATGLFVMELLSFEQQQEYLPADMLVAGIPVGGMLPGEARATWERTLTQPLTLWYGESPILLDPATIGFRINSESMLADAASNTGAGGNYWSRFLDYLTLQESHNIISIDLRSNYQQNLLEQFLQDISQRYDRDAGETLYDVQTLTLRPGAGGRNLNIQAATNLIDAALHNPIDRNVTLPIYDTGLGATNISTLENMIVDYLDSEGFLYDGETTVASIYIMDLQTGEEVNLLGDVAFSAASTIKFPIMIEYYRNLNFPPNDDEAFLLANSLLCSNNSSSNLLMEIIGGGNDIFQGLRRVTETTQYLGARNTYITAPFVLGIEGQQFGSNPAPRTSPNPHYNTGADPYNQTTAEDLGTLFNMTYDCANYGSGLMAAYPDGEFTQNECRQMLELMTANDLERLLQGGVPADARISHKNGWLSNIHGDAGIVYPPNGRNYIISVFIWQAGEFFTYERAWPLVEGISRAAWNYFSPDAPLITPRNDLPITARECEGDFRYLPPYGQVNLDDINAWRRDTQ